MVSERVGALVHGLDRVVPGRVVGVHLFGSVALGAFRVGRSDIDVLVVLDRRLDLAELGAVRTLHRRAYRRAGIDLLRRRWPLVCNGVFVVLDDLTTPPGDIVPVASQTGYRFDVGTAFDVNPVVWHELLHDGVAIRGPEPSRLGLAADPVELERWTCANLEAYWRPWSTAVRRPGPVAVMASGQHLSIGWGVLGAPRLHYTIATGGVVSKPDAARYGLDVFDREWHPLLQRALVYWEGERSPFALARGDRRRSGAFVEMVCDAARELPSRAAGTN